MHLIFDFPAFSVAMGNPEKKDYNMELFQIVDTFLMAILMSQIKKTKTTPKKMRI